MAKKLKLPKSFTTVTPFSKALALSMFIIFPIVAFLLGRTYEKEISPVGYCAPSENTLRIDRSK